MKKKIFIAIIALVGIISILGVVFMNKDNDYQNDITTESKKIDTKDIIDNEKDKTISQKEENIITDDKPNEEDKKITEIEKKTPNTSESTSKTTPKSSTPKSTTPNQTESSVTTKKNSQESGVIDQNGNKKEEEEVYVVKKEPWKDAGVSEYDWYHKPIHDWMRVDYSVSECGSVSMCESLCMNDAEELAYTENVSCIQVYTYSGNYLGEMLKRN